MNYVKIFEKKQRIIQDEIIKLFFYILFSLDIVLFVTFTIGFAVTADLKNDIAKICYNVEFLILFSMFQKIVVLFFNTFVSLKFLFKYVYYNVFLTLLLIGLIIRLYLISERNPIFSIILDGYNIVISFLLMTSYVYFAREYF